MKYKSTLARGLSHAWPWTKPIGSSPTASRLLRYSLLCMLVLLCGGSAWAEDDPIETITLSKQGYKNGDEVSSTKGTAVTLTFDKGTSTNIPAYYDTGTGVRVYAGGKMAVSADGKTITKVIVTFGKDKSPTISINSNGTNTSAGTDSPATWIGSATEVYFNVTNKGHARIQSVEVTFHEDTRTATTLAFAEGYATTGTEGGTIDLPTATVMAGETAVTGAEVTWKSSDESVAKIEGNKISLLSPGTTTITATYAGDDSYKSSKATYDLTVTELSVDGLTSMAIIFKDSGSNSDSGTKITSIADIISEGNNYVSSIPTADNVYNGGTGRGLKLGSSSKSATLKLTLAKAVKPIKITFDAMQYSAGEASITVNGKTITNLGSELATYSVIYDGETEVSSIEISTPSKRAYITNVKIYYEPEATPDPLYILGVEDLNEDNNTWSLPADMKEMTWDAENKVYTYELNNTSTASFCFSTNNEVSDWDTFNSTYRWAIDEGDSDFPQHLVGMPLTLLKVNGTIKLPAGTWTISIATNDTSGEMGMTITGEATPVEEHTYIVAGSKPEIFGMSWDGTYEANKMTKQNDGSYQKTYTVDQAYEDVQLKVVKDGSDWIGDNGYNVSFNLTGAGNFTVTINPETNVVSVTGDIVQFPTTFEYESVYAVGNGEDAWLNGAAWDPAYQDNQMTEVSDGVWEISFENVPDGYERQIKFTIDGAWTHNFGGTFSEFGVATDAVYNGDNIVFNTENDLQNIKVQLDLSNFDFNTKEGAKFTITSEAVEEPGFRDIKLDLTQHPELLTGDDVLITVADDGTIGTTDNQEEAAALVNGHVHSSYGSSNFTAIVPVEGTVKITYATHDYGNDITVTDDNGNEVAKFSTQGAKWMNDPANVVVAYYRTNEPTTLHFSNANYNPYFAVEAIDPADIPAEVTKYTVTFAAGDGVLGVAPAAIEVEAGSETTAPRNTSLYKEGYTLIGWESGNEVILPGAKFTPKADMELTAKFGVNEVSLADREEDVTITYVLDGYNDAPKYNFQSGDGIIVTQATVNEKTIDVAVNTNGMFANNNSGWTLLNKDTKVTVPSCKGATIKVTTYQNANALNFGETAAEPNANPATYTATAEDETLVITQTAQGYWSKLEITLPVVQEEVAKMYLIGDMNGWNRTAMTEMTYNAEKGVYEYQWNAAGNGEGKSYFAVATKQLTEAENEDDPEWDVFNTNYRWGIADGNVFPNLDTEIQLVKVYDGTIALSEPGTYNLTLTKDMKLTISKAADEPQPHDPVNLTWSYDAEHLMPTTSPDNGLYFASYVNDAAGTNNGMHGVKLNSSGWAYFEKPAVEGTLTLTFGNRKKADPFEVNVSRGTLGEDGKAVKGELIGTVAVTESPGTGSIELPADVTGIYIDRKTSSEGVLQKIVFKEKVARTFKDFEITNDELKGTYDPSGLPQGVEFSGTPHNDSHGYQNVTLKVPTDGGAVKFTIGGCQFANPTTFTVTDAEGKTVATLDQKTPGCYHNGGTVTYFYTGEATTLTFGPMAYLPYFKAEATDVQEVTVTFKDQNGTELGKKTVLEGQAIGEVPFTEANLTIPEGEKFRGWVYASGVKVQATDIVEGNKTVSASVTPIETVTEGSIQTYDLTKATFYPEDHETIKVENAAWHDSQHGFSVASGSTISVQTAGKAQVVVTLCQHSAEGTVTVKDANGNPVGEGFNAKVATCGTTAVVNYDGEATWLTFTFSATAYIHSIKVYNVSDFVEKDEESGWYIVPANDGVGLVLALNAASQEADGANIFLPNGTYDLGETVLTAIGGKNVSLIGESMDGVIIKNAPPVAIEGLKTTATLHNTGENLYLQDLTIQNALDYYSAGSAGRGIAFWDEGKHTIAKNVKLLSYQDTYLSTVNQQFYWETSEIHGAVDFICGGSDVFFESTKIVTESRAATGKSGEATITAPQPGTQEQFGYVFNNCTIENNAAKFNLGRAWGGNSGNGPKQAYLNTTIMQPDEIISTRFTTAGMNEAAKSFKEYNSKNSEGTVISPTSNILKFTHSTGDYEYETILSETEAANYALDKVFPSWAPNEIATQIEAPVAELKDGVITWEKVDGATAYALFNNGSLMAIVDGETTSYTIEDAESGQGAPALLRGGEDSSTAYTIRAANGRGGFGEPKIISKATGIKGINAELNGDVKIYDLNGRRVMTPTTGVYIINGKKVVIK